MDLAATFLLILGLEMVLGIDNILVISILVSRLEESQRNRARIIGLALAMGMRIGLLFLVLAMTSSQKPLFMDYSVRDLVLLVGGLFLIWKAIKEIHHTVEVIEDPSHTPAISAANSTSAVIKDIVLLDAVFSLDSVITAIGLTSNLMVIIVAVILSFCVVMAFAKPIGEFLMARPSLKILALSFLITIGITLVLEGMHHHVPKAYIYLPMGFAIAVELLQMRFEYNRKKAGQQ